MRMLKDVWADLVEKRLWPVAVALLLALVAVPVVLGAGGADPAPAPPAGAGAVAAVPGGQQIALDVPAPGAGPTVREGRLRNPFKAPRPEPGATGATGATGGAGAPAAKPDATPGKGTPEAKPDAGAKGGGGPAATPTPKGEAPRRAPRAATPREREVVDLHRVTLRVKSASGKRTIRDLAPLAPLGGQEDPMLVFLGVKADGRTLRFLLPSDVLAGGDGACRPSKATCEALEGRAGDQLKLARLNEDGSITGYVVRIVSIERTGSAELKATTAER
jgi:hypothetical protein